MNTGNNSELNAELNSVVEDTHAMYNKLQMFLSRLHVPEKVYRQMDAKHLKKDVYKLRKYNENKDISITNSNNKTHKNKKLNDVIQSLSNVGCYIHLLIETPEVDLDEYNINKSELMKLRERIKFNIKQYSTVNIQHQWIYDF